jgi:hypothetical protein
VERLIVEHLAGMVRDSAGEGERASAAWLAERLGPDAWVEPYRSQRTYAGVHAVHYAAALVGGPAALAALASLELEVSGRNQWVRRLLPASEGANVVWRRRADGPALVLVAHHDAARTGFIWDPRMIAGQSLINGFHRPVAAGMLLAALPWRTARRAGRALLAFALLAAADVWRSPTVPGASDNATGVAVALGFAADPPEGIDLWVLLPGSEESGMGGMRAFLHAHRDELDPARTLFLGLDTLGAGTPVVLTSEGSLLKHRYADEDLALVPERVERRSLAAWTDPILARFAGFRTLSLLSLGDPYIPNYHLPTDTPDRVDWVCVDECARIAREIADAWREAAPSAR